MDLSNKKYYINRELSWLEFNDRVLEEAQDKKNPLIERLKFLAITSSNLDEFFMVRVSTLVSQIEAGRGLPDPSGLSPLEQLKKISIRVHDMVSKQYSCLYRSILPSLEKEEIYFLSYNDLSPKQEEFTRRYFNSTIFPILTPMAIDNSRPFPLLNNKALVYLIELESENDDEENLHAVMQVPTVIPRIIELPKTEESKREFIFLEDIIKNFISELFEGHKVLKSALFRITRSSDFEIDEEDAPDLINEIEKYIKQRKWGKPVRLEIEKDMSKSSVSFLKKELDVQEEDLYRIKGFLDSTVWFQFEGFKGFEHLKNSTLRPNPVTDFMDKDIFETIREKDILLHHPYDSFSCVIDFLREAALDPQVLAIKQTLYRVSGNSPVVNALMEAAENGKQVTVVVELKARFDEENNINWARKLEQAGCHVVYGLTGLKTHCKALLVVRKEEDRIRRYVHLSTGNYNDSTAKLYTDIGYFTCKETFGKDISALFNVLTGYSKITGWNKIYVAPAGLRKMIIKEIEREEENALAGRPAQIIAKMNSLVDEEIIKALYKASEAGVKINLIVRGICCLRSGVPELSENIKVVSIVDRFLEHSRIYYFENDQNPRIFLASADWMPRNFDRRVEIAFPIEEKDLKEEIINMLDITLSDTDKLRIQKADGLYERVDKRGKEHINSQLVFYERSRKKYLDFLKDTTYGGE
ncbi:MAG: RNA degradosome polyphosphate kinase [Lachnospiraceae bacterium]|nr:RNA degradosome polyphosphate kinase [Lachnospiraceae bacterium]